MMRTGRWVAPVLMAAAVLAVQACGTMGIGSKLPEGAHATFPAQVTLEGKAESKLCAQVSMDFFHDEVQPVLGRSFIAAEYPVTPPTSAMISFAIWQKVYGGSTSVLGKEIAVDGKKATIVGVMPRKFDQPQGVEIWLPVQVVRRSGGH
jgi:hypothetical protein